MKYRIFYTNPQSRYLHIEQTIENINADSIEVQLPAWRPGRYELGNFAKNVQDFKVVDNLGKPLNYQKITKDRWRIKTPLTDTVTVKYNFYSAELTAGSTYLDKEFVYMNPVNCLMYAEGWQHEPCQVYLELPNDYILACSMKKQDGHSMWAENFEELADSPFIASSVMQHKEFEVSGCNTHVWVLGETNLDVDNLCTDIAQYTVEQVKLFGEIPCKDYHYLYIMVPHSGRHGVEHKNSTVILMGKANEFDQEEKYHDLLAISSHELYHLWNVKRIRPADMYPYDYTKENYSTMGYVYEGVTTYQGDLMLLRSGAWDFERYANSFSGDVIRHFDNYGRYYYSVAESSYDTWLDGYEPGVPNRKVSIYIEGMLATLILDLEIRKATDNSMSVHTLMRVLYEKYAQNNKGFTEEEYKQEIETIIGKDMTDYFNKFINGRGEVEKYLPEVLSWIGCQLVERTPEKKHEALYGFRVLWNNMERSVFHVVPDSPAEKAGLGRGDLILSVNGTTLDKDNLISDLVGDGSQPAKLVVREIMREREVTIEADGKDYFTKYILIKNPDATDEQKAFFKAWSNQEF